MTSKHMYAGLVVLFTATMAATTRADDWPTYQHDAAHTGFSNIALNASQLTLAWKTPVGYNYPVIAGGRMYAVNGSSVSAFNLSTGAIEWSTPVTNPQFLSVANGLLITGSYSFGQSKTLQVLDANSGATRYAVPFGSNQSYPGVPTVYTDPNFGLTALDIDASGTLFSIKLGQTAGSINWSKGVAYTFGMPPTVVGNSAIVASYSEATAVDLTTGARNVFFQGQFSSAEGFGAAYDATRHQLYFVNAVSNSHPQELLAYSYSDNSHLTPLWSRDITSLNFDPALDGSGNVFLTDYNTLTEYNPLDGTTMQSLGGQAFAAGSTPELTQGYLFDHSDSQQEIYSLSSLSLVKTLSGAATSQLTSVRSTSAITDGYFASQNDFFSPTDSISVYVVVPEPASFTLFLAASSTLLRRCGKLQRWHPPIA
jgi:hypothetical protein